MLLKSGEERVCGISEVGLRYSDPYYRKTGIPREICYYTLHLISLVENTEDSL